MKSTTAGRGALGAAADAFFLPIRNTNTVTRTGERIIRDCDGSVEVRPAPQVNLFKATAELNRRAERANTTVAKAIALAVRMRKG